MSGREQGMAVTNRDSSLGAGAFVLPPTSRGSVRKEECGVAHRPRTPQGKLDLIRLEDFFSSKLLDLVGPYFLWGFHIYVHK